MEFNGEREEFILEVLAGDIAMNDWRTLKAHLFVYCGMNKEKKKYLIDKIGVLTNAPHINYENFKNHHYI